MIYRRIAVAKANTAREFQCGRPATSSQRVKPENKIALRADPLPRIAFLGGGVPVRAGLVVVIGGIGASGGSEDQDIECAEVCLAAFAA